MTNLIQPSYSDKLKYTYIDRRQCCEIQNKIQNFFDMDCNKMKIRSHELSRAP